MPLDATLTVAQAASLLQLREHTVLSHIRSGALRAANVSTGTARPRWRITRDDLDLFLAARSGRPVKQARRSSRRNRAHFFR